MGRPGPFRGRLDKIPPPTVEDSGVENVNDGDGPPPSRVVTDELDAARRRIATLEEQVRGLQAEPSLRALVAGTATAEGEMFFQTLVRYLTQSMGCRYSFIAEFDKKRAEANTIAFCDGQEIHDNFRFDIRGTPCERVLSGKITHIADGTQAQFPRDRELSALKVRSYLAIPLIDPEGEILGHLAVMDTEPLDADEHRLSVFHIFAARATAQLMIRRAESQLERTVRHTEKLEDARKRAEAESSYLRQEVQGEYQSDEIIGMSGALQAVMKHVEVVAPTDSTVLVLGETGTGKELMARAIHARSPRSEGPFIKLNCAAIPEHLVESELFGHEKGAFTGALERRLGRFELADGGTLFLDEIGELPSSAQARTLRVLQEREFDRVGGTKPVSVDVRILAATNRNLEERAAEGTFRPDLFYRLNVFPIIVPPLRDRLEDLPLLVRSFVERFNARVGRQIVQVSDETIAQLSNYDWPGNIRELQNTIERAVILSSGPQLQLPPGSFPTPADATSSSEEFATLEDVERVHIQDALEKSKGAVGGSNGAAVLLGLHPSTLKSRMKKLGIQRLS